jgi:outer membrane lipopolysaccharide assembly protein LptE/RlpB
MKSSWTGARILLACGLALAAAACGYHFAGGGSIPGGIRFIGVEMLENRTTETGVGNDVTNDLIYELTRSGRVSVVDPERAEAVLSGTIQSIRVQSIARSGQNVPLERRAIMQVDLILTRKNGDVLWAGKSLTANEDYRVESDKLATERNKRDAIREISQRMAERVYRQMTEDF